jgi:hypothetical protein
MIISKHEILSQMQIFKSQIQNVGNLNILNCNLFRIWCLEFRIFNPEGAN